MKKSVGLFLCCLVVCCLSSAYAATKTVTVTNNGTYTIDDTTYVVFLGIEDAVVLETEGRRTIVRVDKCLTFLTTRTCLNSASETSASFVETPLLAVLEGTHSIEASTIDMGNEVEATVAVEKTGELRAEDVVLILTLPDGLSLEDGSTGRVAIPVGVVHNNRDITYTVAGHRNGTYKIEGLLEYFDGNDTASFPLKNVSLTVSNPISYTVTYNNSTTGESSSLKVEVTRKGTSNHTVIITATFPPEANVTSTSRLVDTTEAEQAGGASSTVLTYKRFHNTTKISLNATYYFTDLPSAPLQISVRYYNSTHTHTFEQNFSYEIVEDSPPSLAVGVDPLVENRTGTLKVTITGNRTGNLVIESTLFNTSITAQNDTYEFPLGPAPAGTYALRVSFVSIHPYRGLHEAKGIISVTVQPATLVTGAADDESSSGSAAQGEGREGMGGQTETTDTDASADGADASWFSTKFMLWAGVGAALGLLFVLLIVVKQFSDPVAKLEHLMDRIVAARAALQASGKIADTQSEAYRKLEKLERELSRLQRKL